MKSDLKALILGANGLVGSHVTQLLLENDAYSRVIAVTRRPLPIQHPKLQNILSDIDHINPELNHLRCDHLYIAIGTTKKKTPNREEYVRIDHDYPVEIARRAKENGCTVVNVVSSVGADPSARTFYLRLKGRLEQSLIELRFANTNIFRPSLLLGKREESRFGEELGKAIMQFYGFLFRGKLRKYRAVSAKEVAQSMIRKSLRQLSGVHVFDSSEMGN